MTLKQVLDNLITQYPSIVNIAAYPTDDKIQLRITAPGRELLFAMPNIGLYPSDALAQSFIGQFGRNYEAVLSGTWQGMVA